MTSRVSNIVVTVILLLGLAACQKDNTNPQNTAPVDYAVQVIPDIQTIFADHLDLISFMDTLLHFGDMPPRLTKTVVNSAGKEILWGFCNDSLVLKKYHKSDPTTVYTPSDMIYGTYCFLFNDQHRGVSSMHFRSNYHDDGPDNYYFETAKRTNSVYIMGSAPYFTAYYFQERKKNININGYSPTDPGAKEAIILTGEVTNDGIKDLYIGFKVYAYDDPSIAGFGGFNIGDIAVYYRDFMPFTYWNPNQNYNH